MRGVKDGRLRDNEHVLVPGSKPACDSDTRPRKVSASLEKPRLPDQHPQSLIVAQEGAEQSRIQLRGVLS